MEEDEITYEELLPWQKTAASTILFADASMIMTKGRRSGKTFLRKYIIQELKKRDLHE